MMRYGTLLTCGALIIAAGGCEDGSEATGPEGRAAIEGRVASTAAALTAGPAGASAAAAQASTVAVTQVGAGGSVDLLAEAAVEAAGAFRVENVPGGRAGLVVVARDESQADVGGVLVHGETEADVTTVVAPIDAETTLESRAFIRLRADGEAEAAMNPGGLAAFVRVTGSGGDALASSSAAVDAVAAAFAESQATLRAAFGEFGAAVDAEVLGEATADAAAQYAAGRHGGATADASHEILVGAVLDVYADAGASNRDIALATAASASGAAHASASGGEAVRLELVRHAVDINLRARQRVAAELSGTLGAAAVVEALGQARADLQAAGSPAAVQADLQTLGSSVEAAVVAGVLDLLSGFSLVIRNEAQAQIAAAFEEADLAGRLSGEASAAARAEVLVQYRADVEAAVAALAAAVPEEVTLDTEAMVSLLIAARGSAAVS